MVWLLVILLGIFREGFIAILITMVMEVKEVGVVYAATALGLPHPYTTWVLLFLPRQATA